MEEIKKQLHELNGEFSDAFVKMRIDEHAKEFESLTTEVNSPDFWQKTEQKQAQMKAKKLSDTEALIDPWLELKHEFEEMQEFLELEDDALVDDISVRLDAAKIRFEALKKDLKFSGPHDAAPAVLTISAGAGGLDAQDWANMLQRMYSRWADKNDMTLTVLEESYGDEGGIKSCSLLIGGTFAFGKLKSENGVHRLVRLSPFNSANSRETSFAMVEVIPEVESPDEIEILDADLRVDVYRAGGHGGQSVNTTDSAVRITHIPTNIVVSIQNERSQIQNKETAMKILKSKLAVLAEEQHKEAVSELKGPNVEAAWGNQIRSYVLHPYTMVKDTRTGAQLNDAQKVLDGDLDELINSYLDSIMGEGLSKNSD